MNHHWLRPWEAWRTKGRKGPRPKGAPFRIPKWAWTAIKHFKPGLPKSILIREKLVRVELAAARLGIREVGPDNHGPEVKAFLANVGLPEGYAWCDAFQSTEEQAAAGQRLPLESASVYATWEKAVELGWTIGRAIRGALVCFNWSAPGPPFRDHIGLVVKVVKWGPVCTIVTVEGNTGPQSGSGREGVYVRTRVIGSSYVGFIAIPGRVKV